MGIAGGVPYQFGADQGLSTDEAYAACGPAAAVAFARANGRNPTLREAVDLARQVGWTAGGGMNGVANQKRLLDRMGVPARLDTNPSGAAITRAAGSGQAVTISTPIHYYVADDYDPATGQLHVGNSGRARKGGGEWMTLAQISQRDGGINGALYTDVQGGAAMATRSGAPQQVATPKPTDAHAGLLERRQRDLETAQQNVQKAQAEVGRLSTPDPNEDTVTPEGKAAARARQSALRTAQTALNSANQTVRATTADIRRLEGQIAAGQDNANVARDPYAAYYNRPTTITPARNERNVGVFNPQTGQIDYSPNPNYVDPSQEPMTPYQSAGVEVSRMSAAAALMHAQVAEGTLSLNTAKDFLDRVEKMPAITKVGDKWYYTGMEPGGFYQQLGQQYGYKASVVEANVADVAAVLGHPEYNGALVSGPYKRALEEGGVATGTAAGTIPRAGDRPQAPPSPESSAAMRDLPSGGDVGQASPGEASPPAPTFGPVAGEPGGPTQPDVQANERTPRFGRLAVAGQPGGPTQPQVQANEQQPVPVFGRGHGGFPTPDTITPATKNLPSGANVGTWPPAPAGYGGLPPNQPGAPAMPAAAPVFPSAVPTPDQAALVGAAGPIPQGGPQMGNTFRDRMIQHLIGEQGKSPEDAMRIADAYLAQNGGQ